MRFVDNPDSIVVMFAFENLAGGVLDACIDSYMVEQARCHKRGSQDFQVFNMTSFGIGMASASLLSYFLLGGADGQDAYPLVGIGFIAFVAMLITIGGALIDDSMETNEYAQIKDCCLDAYLEE